jgi:regulator of replication initiation timing
MRSMFTLNMEGLQLRLYQFQCLLKEILPDLSQYLDSHGVHAAMYASQWFLTLFAYGFPITLVARIYDIIFAEGAAETIMRVAIAMLKRSQDRLLHDVNPEFEDILDYVTSRKLCEPYTDNYGNVIRDAMALSGIITREKMDRLGEEYNKRTTDEQQEQVVLAATAGRFGFWKRRKRYNPKKPDMRRSASAGGSVTDSNSSLPPNNPASKPPTLKKRWSSVSSPRDWAFNNSTTCFNNDEEYATKLEETTRELEELKKKHQKTLDNLLEVQYDKQDLACERDALKLTITELERSRRSDKRYCCDSPIMLPARSFSDLSVANNKDGHANSVFTRGSSSIASSRKNSIHASSSSNTMLTLMINMNKSYESNEYDHDILYTPTNINQEEQELSSQLVHIKVKNFELEQQCEKLNQDLEMVQSKFDMVNEGQMALVDKLISMKTEIDEVKSELKDKDLAYLDLQEENHELRLELSRVKERFLTLSNANVSLSQQASNVRRHSTTSLSLVHLENRRIRNLEVSLTTSKIKLAECEFVQTLTSHPTGKKKPSLYGRVLQAFTKTPTPSPNLQNTYNGDTDSLKEEHA